MTSLGNPPVNKPHRLWDRVDRTGGPDACWPCHSMPLSRTGYGHVKMDGVAMAHRIAWTITRGPIPDGLCVLHRCDNRVCCNPAHLFIGTRADNNHDMVKKGRQVRGSKVGGVKLTDDDVIAIRSLYRGNDVSQYELARMFGVKQPTINNIICRRKWTWT